MGGEKPESLPALEDTLPPSEKGDVLELDELWSCVGAKRDTCWLGVVLCRRTRQFVAYTLGDRSQESAFLLREVIPKDYARRATRSDFWELTLSPFLAGRNRACGKEEGETNHVERWLGTLRARTSRLVRRAYSFSKSEERHADVIHLFITTYNLQIQQRATPC